MKTSIQHLLRTPVKTALFLLLVAAGTALLVFSAVLWTTTVQKMDAVEGMFTTIATVTQASDDVAVYSSWDAATKTYRNFRASRYSRVLGIDALLFDGANYINGPEKRPYYGAYLPEYKKTDTQYGFADMFFVAEFTPLEDCVPTEPVPVQAVRVLHRTVPGNDTFWFCDHHNDTPPALEKGKTYIGCLFAAANAHADAASTAYTECYPWMSPDCTQFDQQGNPVDNDVAPAPAMWEEVGPDFYNTARGKVWQNLLDSICRLDETIPVLPTNALTLLPSFHSGDALLTQGREISAAEFADGARVCLISAEFAQNNALAVGDTLPLPLYFANHRSAPGLLMGYATGALDFSLLNSAGDLYPVFSREEYTIVGIYRYRSFLAGGLGASEIGRDTVIIPMRSVRASDQHNIANFGPMQATTTSFQIENGTIAAFDARFAAQPQSKHFEIRYDDGGYEAISGSLQNT
ncbi:MAG: hypothetical protein PHO66_06700, partial [Eubacteriales bacterium]|nr:hypothetical protein [Eubacteriales bacterium]